MKNHKGATKPVLRLTNAVSQYTFTMKVQWCRHGDRNTSQSTTPLAKGEFLCSSSLQYSEKGSHTFIHFSDGGDDKTHCEHVERYQTATRRESIVDDSVFTCKGTQEKYSVFHESSCYQRWLDSKNKFKQIHENKITNSWALRADALQPSWALSVWNRIHVIVSSLWRIAQWAIGAHQQFCGQWQLEYAVPPETPHISWPRTYQPPIA